MIDWVTSNWQYILGTIFLPIVIAGVPLYIHKRKKVKNSPISDPENILPGFQNEEDHVRKKRVSILFIDDDIKFKVVTILKKSGWLNTKSIKDIKNLDDQIVRETDIFFVDVQGVGLALQFNEEGLGLALALKNKYPNKKVVIYSAETKGDRFHEALRKADSFLPKNAEPYEFQQLVEQFSLEI